MEENLRGLALLYEQEDLTLGPEGDGALWLNSQCQLFFSYMDELDQLHIYIPLLSIRALNMSPDHLEGILSRVGNWRYTRADVGSLGLNAARDTVVFYNSLDMSTADKNYLSVYVPAFLDVAFTSRSALLNSLRQRAEKKQERGSPRVLVDPNI